MNDRMLEVMQRRGELLAKIAVQREQMAEIGARCHFPMELMDRGMAAARFLRSHPVLTAGIAALFVVRRRGMAGLARSGWRVWKGYRFLAELSRKLRS